MENVLGKAVCELVSVVMKSGLVIGFAYPGFKVGGCPLKGGDGVGVVEHVLELSGDFAVTFKGVVSG